MFFESLQLRYFEIAKDRAETYGYRYKWFGKKQHAPV